MNSKFVDMWLHISVRMHRALVKFFMLVLYPGDGRSQCSRPKGGLTCHILSIFLACSLYLGQWFAKSMEDLPLALLQPSCDLLNESEVNIHYNGAQWSLRLILGSFPPALCVYVHTCCVAMNFSIDPLVECDKQS